MPPRNRPTYPGQLTRNPAGGASPTVRLFECHRTPRGKVLASRQKVRETRTPESAGDPSTPGACVRNDTTRTFGCPRYERSGSERPSLAPKMRNGSPSRTDSQYRSTPMSVPSETGRTKQVLPSYWSSQDEGSLVLREELLDVHCLRAGELADQIVRHLEDAVLEVRHHLLAVAFEMAVIAQAEERRELIDRKLFVL